MRKKSQNKKANLVQVLQTPLCPYWHYDTMGGRVVIYKKRGTKLTVGEANTMIDWAKMALLNGDGQKD